MTKHDITFLTYNKLPHGDPDDLLALNLLAARGYKTQAAVWNDAAVDWSQAGLCVLRSTWDYHLHFAEFSAFLERLAKTTTLLNPIELLRYSSDKRVYMEDLAAKGAPVVQTTWFAKGESVDLASQLHGHGWQKAVIKPGVGCGTFGVKKVTADDAGIAAGQEHLEKLLERGAAMLQPYLEGVHTYGERALSFIDGRYSHATRKTAFQALLPTGEAGEQPVKATRREITAAQRVVALLHPRPLYARVDLVPDHAGRPCVLELELLEPSLFLSMDKRHAPKRFADAIERALAG
jgi:glutathione synthase/RimK-type ligase-like ATP-grasp enzyme